MPIEIFELVVKASLTEQQNESNGSGQMQVQSTEGVDHQILVEEAVAQVLAILNYKDRR